VSNPWTNLLLAVLIVLALAPGLTKLKADFSYRIWFRESEPLLRLYDDFQAKFGNDDLVNIIIHSPDGIFDKQSIKVVQELTEGLWLVPDVISVDSITNYQWTEADEDDITIEDFIPEEFDDKLLLKKKQDALNDKTLPDYLINRKGTVTNIYAKIRPYFKGAPDDKIIIEKTRELIKRVKEKLPKSDKHEIYTNGSLDINNTFREVSEHDVMTIFPIVFGIIFIFLLYTFKRFVGLALPVLVITFTTVSTFGIAGYLGIKFNNLIAMVPTILIAIAIADSVHVLVTYFQFRSIGNKELEATKLAFEKNIKPTLLTSISTTIGFLSCTTSDLIPLSDMGLLAAFGTMLAWIFSMLIIAPILSIKKIHWEKNSNKTTDQKEYKLASVIIDFIDKYKFLIFYGLITLAAVFTYFGSKNEVNSNPYDYFSSDVPLKKSNDFTLENLGGFYGPQLVIESGIKDGIKDPIFLKNVDKFQRWLEDKEYISRVTSVVEIVKSMNKSMHGDREEFYKIPDERKTIAELLFLYSMSLPQGKDLNDRMTINRDALRMAVMWKTQGSKLSLQRMAMMEEKARDFNLKAVVTGKIPIYQNMTTFVVKSFFSSIMLALVGISILLIIIFKSFKLGFSSMIPNVLPLAFGAGAMTLLEKPIDVGTALVSSVCLGIVVDDTIHFLSSYNIFKAKGNSTKDALKLVLGTTGSALFWTTSILVVGFGAMVFADFTPNSNFGILTALVLTIALIIDLVFLPALLLITSKEKS
jgi:predicted RND superfamily exporter protein